LGEFGFGVFGFWSLAFAKTENQKPKTKNQKPKKPFDFLKISRV
jgi:hypothetical protein